MSLFDGKFITNIPASPFFSSTEITLTRNRVDWALGNSFKRIINGGEQRFRFLNIEDRRQVYLTIENAGGTEATIYLPQGLWKDGAPVTTLAAGSSFFVRIVSIDGVIYYTAESNMTQFVPPPPISDIGLLNYFRNLTNTLSSRVPFDVDLLNSESIFAGINTLQVGGGIQPQAPFFDKEANGQFDAILSNFLSDPFVADVAMDAENSLAYVAGAFNGFYRTSGLSQVAFATLIEIDLETGGIREILADNTSNLNPDSITYHDGVIYSQGSNFISAIDVESGSVIWKKTCDAGSFPAAPVYPRPQIKDGYIHFVIGRNYDGVNYGLSSDRRFLCRASLVDGNVDAAFMSGQGNGLDNAITSFVLTPNHIFIAGVFTNFDGVNRRPFIALTYNGTDSGIVDTDTGPVISTNSSPTNVIPTSLILGPSGFLFVGITNIYTWYNSGVSSSGGLVAKVSMTNGHRDSFTISYPTGFSCRQIILSYENDLFIAKNQPTNFSSQPVDDGLPFLGKYSAINGTLDNAFQPLTTIRSAAVFTRPSAKLLHYQNYIVWIGNRAMGQNDGPAILYSNQTSTNSRLIKYNVKTKNITHNAELLLNPQVVISGKGMHDDKIFVAGDFVSTDAILNIRSKSNLSLLNSIRFQIIAPAVQNPSIYSMIQDGDFLYIAGAFNYVSLGVGFYETPSFIRVKISTMEFDNPTNAFLPLPKITTNMPFPATGFVCRMTDLGKEIYLKFQGTLQIGFVSVYYEYYIDKESMQCRGDFKINYVSNVSLTFNTQQSSTPQGLLAYPFNGNLSGNISLLRISPDNLLRDTSFNPLSGLLSTTNYLTYSEMVDNVLGYSGNNKLVLEQDGSSSMSSLDSRYFVKGSFNTYIMSPFVYAEGDQSAQPYVDMLLNDEFPFIRRQARSSITRLQQDLLTLNENVIAETAPVIASITHPVFPSYVEYEYEHKLNPVKNNSIAEYAVSNLPEGLVVNATSAKISGKAKPSEVGVTQHQLSVTNWYGASQSENFSLEVKDRAPWRNMAAYHSGDGHINAVSETNSQAIYGGKFTHIGQVFNGLIAANINSGNVEINTIKKVHDFNGNVKRLVRDGSSLYVFGDFTKYGEFDYPYFLKFNLATGEVDHAFMKAMGTGFSDFDNNARIVTCHILGNSLFICGSFTKYNGEDVGHVVQLNKNTAVREVAFESGKANNEIMDMAFDPIGGKLWLVGKFSSFAGDTNASYMAIISAITGTLDNTYFTQAAFNFNASRIKYRNNSMYIIGEFTNYRAATRRNIVRLNASTGDLNASFLTQFDTVTEVQDFDLNDNALIIAVNESGVYDANGFNQGIIKLNPINGAFNYSQDTDGIVYSVRENGSFFILAGDFGEYYATPTRKLVRIEADTGNVAIAFDGPEYQQVRPILDVNISSNTMYLANSDAWKLDTRENLAVYDYSLEDGLILNTAFVQPNDEVTCIEKSFLNPTSYIFIGGKFTQINGLDRKYISKINLSSGQIFTGWNSDGGFDGEVKQIICLAESPTLDSVFVRGDFTEYNIDATVYASEQFTVLNGTTKIPYVQYSGITDQPIVKMLRGQQRDNAVILVGNFTQLLGVAINKAGRIVIGQTVPSQINFSVTPTSIDLAEEDNNGMLLIKDGNTLRKYYGQYIQVDSVDAQNYDKISMQGGFAFLYQNTNSNVSIDSVPTNEALAAITLAPELNAYNTQLGFSFDFGFNAILTLVQARKNDIIVGYNKIHNNNGFVGNLFRMTRQAQFKPYN